MASFRRDGTDLFSSSVTSDAGMGDLIDLIKADWFSNNSNDSFQQQDDFDVNFSVMDAPIEDDSLLNFFSSAHMPMEPRGPSQAKQSSGITPQNRPSTSVNRTPKQGSSQGDMLSPSPASLSLPQTANASFPAPDHTHALPSAHTRNVIPQNTLYAGPVPAAWVAHQLQLRMKEVAAESLDLSVCCCSWNVNGKKPTEEALDTWLAPLRARVTPGNNTASVQGSNKGYSGDGTGASVELQKPYDIVAVSFQEIVDLSAKNLIVDPYATGRWEVQISSVLERVLSDYLRQKGERRPGEGPGYVLLCSTHLVGLALCVWVRSELLPLVSRVKTGRVGVGIMGVGGNKGAVGVSMCIGHTSLCFLNAHIAAHQHKVNDRNMHYHTILKRFRFDTARPLSASRAESGMLRYIIDKNIVVIPNKWPAFRPMPSLALSAIYGGGHAQAARLPSKASIGAAMGTGGGAGTVMGDTVDVVLPHYIDTKSSNGVGPASSLASPVSSITSTRSGPASEIPHSQSQPLSHPSLSGMSPNVVPNRAQHASETDFGNMDTSEVESDSEPIIPPQNIPESSRLQDLTVLDHDHVLWMGDLNYRLAHPDLNRVHRKIIQGDLPFLLQYDQLSVEKRAGRAFSAFHELPITFPPTYKYTPGTHTYEQRPNKKLRMPSWCDRIQWRSLPANSVTPIEYNRAMLLLSDHKPVRLSLALQAYVQSAQKRRALLLALKQLSGASVLPRLQLDWGHVHWPEIRYNIPVTHNLTVTNTGNCVVRYIASVCAADPGYLPHYHLDHTPHTRSATSSSSAPPTAVTTEGDSGMCEIAPLVRPLQGLMSAPATYTSSLSTSASACTIPSPPSTASSAAIVATGGSDGPGMVSGVGSVSCMGGGAGALSGVGSSASSFMTIHANALHANTRNNTSSGAAVDGGSGSGAGNASGTRDASGQSYSSLFAHTSTSATISSVSPTPAFALAHIAACTHSSCPSSHCSHPSPSSSPSSLSSTPHICSHTLRPRRHRVGHRTPVDPVTSLWLSASPSTGMLNPGESVTVQVTVLVKGLEGHRCNMEQLSLLGRVCVRAQDACVRQWNEEVGPACVVADEQVHVAAQHVGFLEAKDEDDDEEEEEKEKEDRGKEKSKFGKFFSLFSNKGSVESSNSGTTTGMSTGTGISLDSIVSPSTIDTLSPPVTPPSIYNNYHTLSKALQTAPMPLHNIYEEAPLATNPHSTTVPQNTTMNGVPTRHYNADLFWAQQATPIEYSAYVSGKYVPSAWGASLSHLCALKGPVRTIESGNLYVSGLAVTAQSVTQSARNISSAALVPKELFYLVQTALTHPQGGALSCPDFLLVNSRKPGQNPYLSHPVLSPALEPVDPALVLRVRDVMDTCPHLLQVLVRAYDIPLLALGHAMLDFLTCLCEPLLSPSLVTHLAPDTDLSVWVRALLAELPTHSYACLAYIISLCRSMLDSAHMQHTKVSAQFLTLALTKPLTHSIDTGRPFSETQSKSAMHVVYHLLKSGAEKDLTAGNTNK